MGNNEIINKKAFYDYEIIEKYEAGIVLYGWEAKALLNKLVTINNSHIIVKNCEIFLLNSIFSDKSNTTSFVKISTDRNRKLLLKKCEINKLIGSVQNKGLTMIPLRIYLKGKKYKVELALARGKKTYDKRDSERSKDIKRDNEQMFKNKIKIS